jgi:hypothetical protein
MIATRHKNKIKWKEKKKIKKGRKKKIQNIATN